MRCATFFLPSCNSSSLTLFSTISYPKPIVHTKNLMLRPRFFSSTQVALCSKNDIFEDIELLSKPTQPITPEPDLLTSSDAEEDGMKSLEPFLKFFKPRKEEEAFYKKEDEKDIVAVTSGKKAEEAQKVVDEGVLVEYYEPKSGDYVVGVVVSGNENRLDVNIGADLLGVMLTKEVLPFYDKEMEWLLSDAQDLTVGRGKMGIVKNDEAISVNGVRVPSRPVVEAGTVLFALVLGRTLSGRPLLSCRRYFRLIAWHRVRQIKHLNEPVLVTITEWNTGGLLTRIEGLRGFLPKGELINKVNNFTQLKEYVGKQIYVQINRIDESHNDLILSEKEAWVTLNLTEGSLLEGTVRKILPYGAKIRIGETTTWGLLHRSNVSRTQVTSISDLLKVGEKVKVLVVKSILPDKISFSIADLESEPGLFISNKERVFQEAEEMARKYRIKLAAAATTHDSEPLRDPIPFNDEETLYSNWKWFKFERE